MSIYPTAVEFTVIGSAVICCKSLILTSVSVILQKMKGCFESEVSLYIFGCNPLKIND